MSKLITRDDLKAILDKILPSDQVDYVVEQGTSGIWTYRKWSSGKAELWGTWSGNLTHYAQVFGGYAFYTDAIPYPNGFFLEKPNAQYTGTIGSGFCLTGTILANSTKDHITCYGVGTSNGTQACIFYIYATGEWK